MALTDGIIGCWSPSLGVTGNVLRDVSGKNNHGTLQNMDPTTDWVSTSVRGVRGRVLDYDGSNDYIDAKNTMIGRTQPQFACSIWMLVRSNYGIAVSCNWVSGFVWYVLPYLSGNPYGRQSLFIGTGARADAVIPTTLNVWRHYWFSFDNGQTRAGYDGIQNYSATYGNAPSYVTAWGSAPRDNTRIMIGGFGVPGETVDGQIGEFVWWNRSVTAAEMGEVYRQGNGAIGRQLTDYNRRKYFPLYPSKPSKASLISVKPSTPSFENGFAPRDGEADNTNLLKGLVGAWCPSLGVTGNTLRDISGRNNHGTLTNMDPATDWVVSGGKYALDFDGVDDYVVAGSLPDFPNDFTLSGWGYVYSGDTGVDAVLVRTTNVFGGAARSGVSFVMRDAFTSATTERIGCEITDGLNRYHIESVAGYARDTWHHILCRRQAGVFSLWINGVQEPNTQNFSGLITNNTDTYIGAVIDYQGGLSVLRRRVDSVAVYNRALSANEIRQMYQLGRGAIYTIKSQKKIVTSPSRSTPKSRASIIVRPPKPNTDNLLKGIVGCWSPSLGVTGNTLRDVSGRNNHGVLTNMDPATDWVSTSIRGVHGRVLDFDGTDDYVAIARNLFSGLAVLTVSFWGQPRTTTDRVDITQGTDNANRCGCGLAEDGNAYGFSQFNGAVAGFGYAPWSQLGVLQPIHFVGVYNSKGSDNAARSKVYLNGRQQTLTFAGSVSTSAISQGGTAFFGARPGPSSYSNGRMGEVVVWNRELTPAEIRDLYQSGNGAIGRALTQQATRSNFSSKTFPSTWLKVGDEWTEVQPKVATGSQTSIITRPPIEPSYESGYAPRDGEPLYPNLHKGLVGAWCPSLGVTGSVLRDVSGRNNHGTLTNMGPATDWQMQNGQYSLAFVSPKRVVMSATALQPLSYSVSVWAKRNTIASSYRVLWGLGASLSISLWVYGNGDIAFGDAGGTWSAASAIWTDTADWHHIVVNVRNSAVTTGHELFFDGKLITQFSSSSASGVWSNPVLGFWSLTYAGTGFDGWLDDWQWRGRATNPQEVAQWYSLGRGGILTLKQPSLKNTSTIWQPSQPRLYTGDWT